MLYVVEETPRYLRSSALGEKSSLDLAVVILLEIISG